MSVSTTRFSNILGCLVIGLFYLLNGVHTENGLLPHFKVDHVAGKLKIDASRDSADISYNNDAVDLVVKPNNRETAKVIINSMQSSSGVEKAVAKKHDEPVALKSEAGQLRTVAGETGQLRSVAGEAGHSAQSSQRTKNELDLPASSKPRSIETNIDGLTQKIHKKIHLQTSDLGLKRNKISKKSDDEDDDDGTDEKQDKVAQGETRSRLTDRVDTDTSNEKEEGSDITWRGRINHAEEKPDQNSHVLSALNEIKNLMALSMKPPNLKAFDEMIPDGNDKYLTTAEQVVKKLEHGQNKKRQTEATQDNMYIHKVKGMLHPNLDNTSYTDDPSDYGYVKKAHDVIEQEHLRQQKPRRKHVKTTKGCTTAHCRQEMYLTKEEPGSETSFEEQFLGSMNRKAEHGTQKPYHNNARHTSGNNEYAITDGVEYDATTPLHKDNLQSLIDDNTLPPHTDHLNERIQVPPHITPYHANDGDRDEGYHHVQHGLESEHGALGDERHRETSFHGSNNNHHHSTDDAYEKEFEAKLNEDANEEATGSHNTHHAGHARHQAYHDDDVDDDDSFHHDDDHMGPFHGGHGYDEGNYHVPGAPDHHYDRNPSNWESNDGEPEDHFDFHGDYDFDPTKEIKNKEHDLPGIESTNDKLTDWYSKNAIGENLNSSTTTMTEPPKTTEGSIILQNKEDNKKDEKKDEKEKDTKQTKEEKKIENKFENAGEKPLGTKEAEKAIDKLNGTLASALNESTIKSISSYENNVTLSGDLNKTTVAALNSFNTIKLEALNNDTVNAETMLKDGDDGEPKNATHGNAIQDGHSGENKTDANAEAAVAVLNAQDGKIGNGSTDAIKGYNAEDLQKKIKNLQKKLNSTGDLLKKLNDLEKKLNASAEKQIKEKEKQQKILKFTETNMSAALTDTKPRIIDEVSSKSNISNTGDLASQQMGHNATGNYTTATGNGTAIENVYASIGEPGELDVNMTTNAADNSTVKENSTKTDGKAAAAATTSTAAVAVASTTAAVSTSTGSTSTTAPASEALGKSEAVPAVPAAALHARSEDKHAEQTSIQRDFEEDNFIKDYISREESHWTKRHKTVSDETGAAKVGLKRASTAAKVGLKRHKTKVYQIRRKIRGGKVHKKLVKQTRRRKGGLRRHKHKRRSRSRRHKSHKKRH